MERIIGVDPGSEICGVTVLDNGCITGAFNLNYSKFWTKITELLIHPNVKIALEVIRPYSLRLTPQVIDTCQFIGEALFRLKSLLSSGCVYTIPRNEVKKWIYDNYTQEAMKLVDAKIAKGVKKGKYLSRTGTVRLPSFHFVDDEIVKNIMKLRFAIPQPPPGYPYRFGLKDHSWQSLPLCVVLQEKLNNFIPSSLNH